MRWYRLTFNDTTWNFDHSDRYSGVLCNSSTAELWKSGLKEIVKDQASLQEILINLLNKGHINQITYYINSDIFGPGTPRSELLFPQEVFFPSNHELKIGRRREILNPRVVSLKDCTYVFSGIMNIGIAELEDSDITPLKHAKGASFVGCLDNNPFGLISGIKNSIITGTKS
ncbi:putative M protein [Trifolium pratense virus B]|uniref:Putative M protein n=1 Tax=Trifolium pratense virus B TaxID=2448907 RepID=A0A510C2B9_9RHAB|nr:putative M protein [Trifolium pratense virus B]AYH53271.1 putative M protein [Trifolium pratense virus B]